MAGVITHLVIAREILKLLPEGSIINPGLFYLGSLAPDAVHAREDYIRAYKKHSHFRDDIPDKDFDTLEYYEIYHKRLVDFINQYKNKEDGLIDLYRGYVAHILTDELFVLSVRKEFCDIMEKQGISQSDLPFFENIVSDMNRNDMLLVYHYDKIDEIQKYIEQVPAFPIEGYISMQEMSDCRDWLVRQHFYEKHELLQPVYTSYRRTLDFIHMAAEEIVKRLTENKSLPRML